MAKYIISTMAAAVAYTAYEQTSDLPVVKARFVVHGGAGLPSMSNGFGEMTKTDDGLPMWTPDGMSTPCPDNMLEAIKDLPMFKQHLEQGLIKIVDTDMSGNHKAMQKMIATMSKDEHSSILTPEIYHSRVKVSKPSADYDNRI